MTWKIRHQGSPRSIEGLTVPQVVEGLQEGLWETTDEVMGPQDAGWTALENHPQFAEAAAELEPLGPPPHEDETRLDMNPLIDVCLVLLIFFILTTTYAALEKVVEMGNISADNPQGLPVVSREKVDKFMIKAQIRQEGGRPVIRIEDQVVDPEDLVPAIKRYVNDKHKTDILIDTSKDVPWGEVIRVHDAAKGANVLHVHYLKQP
jgi:biopolymer transport protein ExbD